MTFSLNGCLYVQTYGCVSHPSGAWHSGRQLASHLLLYVKEGSVHMQIGDRECVAPEGDILFIPCGVRYRPLASGKCTYYVFHFDMEETVAEKIQLPAIDGLNENCEGFAYFFDKNCDSTLTLDVQFSPANKEGLEEILLRANELDPIHHAGHRMLLELYFREFLVHLSRTDGKKRGLSSTAKKIRHYIHDNIKSPISLSTVAGALYLSPSYVARIFKNEMHESIGDYITKQKINLACALLMDTDMSIGDISTQIGFSTPYYFSNTFSKHMNMTPSAYRKKR